MIDYAATLEFDKETEITIQKLIDEVAEKIVLARAEPYEELRSWELR